MAQRAFCHWTPEEDAILYEYISSGKGVAATARKLQRGEHGIYLRAYSLFGGIAKMRNGVVAVRSLHQIEKFFRVTDSTVRYWVDHGWLKAQRNRQRPQSQSVKYLVHDDDLLDFIAVRDAWPLWNVSDIADPDWRAAAQELRDAAGGEWLTTAEIAKRYGYAVKSVNSWGLRGYLSPLRLRSRLYIWSTDLEQFVPPSERDERRAAQKEAR